MAAHFDAIVAGGSVAGLSFAAEASNRGLSVLVLEEDPEIGEPEKCDGLVSIGELGRYVAPAKETIQGVITKANVFAPSGAKLTLDSSRLGVAVLDRSSYDKQVADMAASAGASIRTGTRVTDVVDGPDQVEVRAYDEVYSCLYFIDATGPSGVSKHNRRGLIPAAKYEVQGDWFTEGEVEVHTDQRRYPGFFAWVIPRGSRIAKVGVAGAGVNSFQALDLFLRTRQSKVLKKVACTIYVGGPIEHFVEGRTIRVGESAGQVKPTTAGGITSSVAAGGMAARWLAESIEAGDPRLVMNYERDWYETFGKEFRLMKRLRHLYETLSNEDIERVIAALSNPRVTARLASASFDFHATAVLSSLGVKGMLQLASVLISAEAKQTLASIT